MAMVDYPHTYETVDHSLYVTDDDVDEFQGVIGQLSGDYSDELDTLALYFIHQDDLEMPNDILECLNNTFFGLKKGTFIQAIMSQNLFMLKFYSFLGK